MLYQLNLVSKNQNMICRKIIVLICTTMFFIHSIICVFKEIATPKKAVDVTPVRLSSKDFPLLFGISINPGYLKSSNIEKFKDLILTT